MIFKHDIIASLAFKLIAERIKNGEMTSQHLINSTLLAVSALTITTIATTNHHVLADETIPAAAQADNLDQQINKTQDQLTQAQNQLTADNQAQTQQLTDQMNQQVEAQQNTNTQAENQMAQDNNAQIQQAQAENDKIDQNAKAQIDALNQAQDTQIKAANDQTAKAVADAQQQAQAQIDAVNQEAEQAIANAKQAVANAQNQSSAYNVKPVNYGDLHDPSINGGMNTDQFDNKAYGDTLNGEYLTYTPYTTNAKNKVDWSTQPQGIQDIPTNFNPGLIAYNPDADNSEKISQDGFSASQLATIRAFATKWTNDFRNYIYNHEPDVWKSANKNNSTDKPLEIEITEATNKLGDAVAQARSQYHVDNNHHSIQSSGLPADQTYTALTKKFLGDADSKTLDAINHELQSNYDLQVKSIQVILQSNGENLMTVGSRYNTMQAYLTEIYNMMQAMYYGELVQTHGDLNIGGHAINVLNNTSKYLAIGLQKLDDQSDTGKLSQMTKNPVYAMTFDFIGDKINLDIDNADQQKEYNQKFQQVADQNITNALGNPIDINQDAVYSSALKRQQAKADPNAESLKDAQANLTKVQNDYAQKVNDLKAASQQKVDQLNQQNAKQVAQIKADTKAKIDALSGQHKLTDIKALQQDLDTKLNNLKQQNAAKIAAIKADYQAKIKALPQTTDQVQQLQSQLETLKAQKAQADRQTPVITTGKGDHRITLPTDKGQDQPKADKQHSNATDSKDNHQSEPAKTTDDQTLPKTVTDDSAKDQAKPTDKKVVIDDSKQNATETSNKQAKTVSVKDAQSAIKTKQAVAITLPDADINAPASQTVVTTAAVNRKQAGTKQLPQTGDDSQRSLSILGLSLISMLTFGLIKLKTRA